MQELDEYGWTEPEVVPPTPPINGPAEPGWKTRTWQVIWTLIVIIAIMYMAGWIQSM
jgi:hypothetical protein